MTCIPPLCAARPAAVAATIAAAMALTAAVVAPTARAQNPTPPPLPSPAPVIPLPAPAPQLAAYRAPVLALVQPPPAVAGAPLTVPQDRPVAVFRFAQGEPADPIDAASFRVAVDGRDRTTRFQVAAAGATGEAWGSLGDASAGTASTGSALTAGAHQIAARVCSTRGACGTVDVTVTAVPATVVTAAAEVAATTNTKSGRGRRVIDFVLNATKRLLAP